MTRNALVLFCLLAIQALFEISSSVAGADDVVNSLSGRYGRHFENGNVQGDVYWSDDVAEIVPVSSRTAYLRIELNFYNGHTCSISGVGEVESRRIVYRPQSPPGDQPCALSISRRGNDLLISDSQGSCKMYCGERGSLTEQTFPFASRRPIRYMQRLKSSKEYSSALREWQSHQKH